MSVTIYDVAKKLNLSASTVSKVLNGHTNSRISPETWELVRDTARDMNYRPNANARALRTSRTGNIALFAGHERELTDPHFGRLLDAVGPRARALGYRIIVCDQLESIAGDGLVDGVIAIAHRPDVYLDPVLAKRPCVFIAHSIERTLNSVTWNDFEGAYKAGLYLLELGHRDIVGIFGDLADDHLVHSPKLDGFSKALRDAGLEPRCRRGELSTDQIENGYLLTRQLLKDGDDFTAVFARNDAIAVGAVRALVEAGESIPGDISVIGYSDTLLARSTVPQLTSVSAPIADAGALALEKLVQVIESSDFEFPGELLPTSIVERDSCAPPSKR